MTKKILLSSVFLCVFCGSAFSQNLATVSGANIEDLNGAKLANGQICFLGTDQSDNPISFQVGGGGQVLRRQYCAQVSNGAIASFTVPNPAATLPTGIYYRVTVKDTSTGLEVLRYTGVTFSGGTFNFDTYSPNPPGFSPAPLSGNSVTGNLGVIGNISASGTIAGSNIPATIPGAGSCSNEFVTALNTAAPPTCGTAPLTTLGDILYESSPTALGRVAGNTTTTKQFLTQTGTGTASAAPAWGTIAAADLTTALMTPPAIGGTTPGPGAFTTLSASGNVTETAGQNNINSWGFDGGRILTMDGNKYPYTCAGLQQILTDACASHGGSFEGTLLLLPPIAITSCNVVQTCALSVWGSGTGRTLVSSATGTTWTLRPALNHAPHDNWELFNMELDSNAGDALGIDDSTAPVEHLWVHRMFFNPAGRGTDWSININSVQFDGGFDWLIENNGFEAGININSTSTTTGTVDGLTISHNNFDNASTDSNPCIRVAQSSGAGNLQIDHNRGGCNGGEVVINQSVNPMLLNNQFEHSAGPGTPSNCMIELSSPHVSNALLINNNLNNHGSPGTATKDVCLNGTSGDVLTHNIMAVPAGGSGVNSSATYSMYSNIVGLGAGATQTSGTGGPFSPVMINTVPIGTGLPTATCTIGTGCSAAINNGGTNAVGQVVITTGTTPSATGTVTLNFNGIYGANQTVCMFAYGNGSGSWTAPITAVAQTATTTQYVASLTNGTTFPASQSLGLKYHCFPF